MKINKDTLIFGSFSSNPGNNGCIYFNGKFEADNINAIYKSWKITSIENALKAMKTLDIKGVGISMPFKESVISYIDEMDDNVKTIGVCNTIINKNNRLIGYNTDYYAINKYLLEKQYKHIYILGNGGYSKTIQYTCKRLNISYEIITRKNWFEINRIKDGIIFNATPLENIYNNINSSNIYIDCIPTTETGKILAKYQAEQQYNIYKTSFNL